MATFLAKTTQLLKLIRGLFPMALPKGRLEFNLFCDFIFETYDLPDLPSYRDAIASMVMHLPPTLDRKAPIFFARSVRKAMANQVAYQMIQESKEAEKEKQKAEAEKAKAEGEVPSSA